AKNPRIPVGSPIPIGNGDGNVNRFPNGDGDGDGDEAEKRGWGCSLTPEMEMKNGLLNVMEMETEMGMKKLRFKIKKHIGK
ncbi:hypothetical protein Tco_1126674, partial [Tanacetum coccineum]